MYINNLFLDSDYRRSLERLAIEEGILQHDSEGMEIKFVPSVRRKLRGRTLLITSIFENVDASYSDYDWHPFVDCGLVVDSAQVLQYNITLTPAFMLKKPSRERLVAKEIAAFLLKAKRTEFVKRHAGRYRALKRNSLYSSEEFGRVFDYCLEHENWIASGDLEYYRDFITDLEAYYGNVESCVYLALEGNSAFALAGRLPYRQRNVPSAKIAEDTLCVARTKLTDEILYLPAPSSLSQALRIRDSRHIARFRSVFAEWCATLREG